MERRGKERGVGGRRGEGERKGEERKVRKD